MKTNQIFNPALTGQRKAPIRRGMERTEPRRPTSKSLRLRRFALAPVVPLHLIALLLAPVAARCDSPSLSVSDFNTAHAVQLALHGQDGTNYEIQVSTNLIVWEPYLSLVPTNGLAVFSPD